MDPEVTLDHVGTEARMDTVVPLDQMVGKPGWLL
jgi:hypothetical protein